MTEPDKSEKKTEQEKDNFIQERQAARPIVQGIAQELIRWIPLGGSGLAFVSLLLKQEWFIAILIFPIMIVAVFWAAFTKGFLTRISEISEDIGEQGANSLTKFIKSIIGGIKWQLAGANDKYLRCQGSACSDYETIGYNQASGTFMPLLKDVFVPLKLSNDFTRDSKGNELPGLPGFMRKKIIDVIRRETKRETIEIWNLLAQTSKTPAYRRLAIQAWGGFGKTTLLRHVTYSYLTKEYKRYKAPQLLPVLLYLRQWQDALANLPPDLPTLIEEYHIPNLPAGKNLKLPPNWVESNLRKGKMLVMFDGFDEVKEAQREALSKWLNEQIRNYPESTFIITSRPRAFKAHKGNIKPGAELFVKEFNQDQQRRFITQWYLAQEVNIRRGRNTINEKDRAEKQTANLVQQLHDREELGALATNPLLLNMMVNLHRSYQGQPLPQRRAELYQDICQLQLKDRPRARGIDMPLPLEESLKLLQGVALDMMQEVEKPRISSEDLIQLVDKHLRNLDTQDPLTSKEFIEKIRDVSELIVKREEEYEFAHLSFQEYLAAKQIKETKQEQLLLDNWQEQWWRGTILLYAALVNPTKLIRSLITFNKDQATTLARRCLEETPRKVDPEIAAELEILKTDVQKQLYQELETYLRNGQWREADEETLKGILKVADREEQGWLDVDDINKFTCEDLLIIDRLWVKYSKGKFGFSIQKEIYESLGGTEEYNEEIWISFGDKIGWRQKYKKWLYSYEIKWIYYEQLTFDLEKAPRAHLPWGSWGILSRAKTCNIYKD